MSLPEQHIPLVDDRGRISTTWRRRLISAISGAGAGLFQPLDARLTSLAGLTYGSNSLKVVRVNAGATGFELATVSAGVSDGDKGDITVTGSGSTWTIDDGAVTMTKLGGDITAAGKALLDDSDAAAQRATLGLGTLATQSGTFSGTSSGTNTGDQTSIEGITGTKAQFDAACTDGNFAYQSDLAGAGITHSQIMARTQFAGAF